MALIAAFSSGRSVGQAWTILARSEKSFPGFGEAIEEGADFPDSHPASLVGGCEWLSLGSSPLGTIMSVTARSFPAAALDNSNYV